MFLIKWPESQVLWVNMGSHLFYLLVFFFTLITRRWFKKKKICFVITHFWVTPKIFFPILQKKNCMMPFWTARCSFFFPAHAKARKKKIFENVFPAHFLSLPLHKTLPKPISTQPYPANVTIKERDTMPCKHNRPPYPAEVRQLVPPLHHDGIEQGGTISSRL